MNLTRVFPLNLRIETRFGFELGHKVSNLLSHSVSDDTRYIQFRKSGQNSMKSQDEIIEVLCNEVGGAVYAGEYDASLIGREFVHFKGGHYRLLGFARFSEGEELMVVYQTLYGEAGMWVRPAKMFFENVTRDGVTQPRFRPL